MQRVTGVNPRANTAGRELRQCQLVRAGDPADDTGECSLRNARLALSLPVVRKTWLEKGFAKVSAIAMTACKR